MGTVSFLKENRHGVQPPRPWPRRRAEDEPIPFSSAVRILGRTGAIRRVELRGERDAKRAGLLALVAIIVAAGFYFLGFVHGAGTERLAAAMRAAEVTR